MPLIQVQNPIKSGMCVMPSPLPKGPCILEVPGQGGKLRGSDRHGAGHYGAPRGSRKHNGVDITATVNASVHAPMPCKIIRKAYPYASDLSYQGVLIKGTGDFSEVEIKMFYCVLSAGKGDTVDQGDVIARVQDLTKKYRGITNHIHLEMKIGGSRVDPTKHIIGL